MIRDIRWAYELGFKRGWKVGNRRGRNASKPFIEVADVVGYNAGISADKTIFNVKDEPLIQRYHNKGCENHSGYKNVYMTFCPECGVEL